MRFLWIWIILILNLYRHSIHGIVYDWLLYSDNEKNTDCFFYDGRYFCRSTENDLLVKRIATECIDGELWSFSKLKDNKVTTDDLINWLIPFHIIEQYAQYLNFPYMNVTGTSTLCNCSQNRYGFNCEYENEPGVSSSALIIRQRGAYRERNFEKPILFIDGTYCNSHTFALEWRQICDGIIDCQDGIDEFNCYLLEFHQCDTDEFQCRNGMCIPKEFLFDTIPDCMDSSDEQETYRLKEYYERCLLSTMPDCDERLCRKDEFSCGDGICVPWSTVIDHSNKCKNSRDVAYICETLDYVMNDPIARSSICEQTISSLDPLTKTSDCITSLRYMLNYSTESTWNKTRAMSFENIIDRCPELIQYPEEPVLSPVLKMYYNKTWIKAFYENDHSFHDQMPRKPHLFCLNGSMVCNGILMTLQGNYCLNQDEFQRLASYPYFPIPDLFCQMVIKQELIESNISLSLETSHRSPLFLSYTCRNTSVRISLRRLNDGYVDCLYGDDEKNNGYQMIQPYRYLCQTVTSPIQYVSYQQLGNEIKECDDGSDEVSREFRWSTFKCDVNDNYACWVLQGDGIAEDRIKDVRLSFHRYCDSVWDTMDGRDEKNCTEWICAQGTYQCHRTGQCIDPTHLCDGEFDCNDGEDELNCSRPIRQWALELECDTTYEHFCITEGYLRDQTSTRPCISYIKAGDGNVDCVGGRDERNVFSCSDHFMLGDRFLCDNKTKCLNYTVICNGINDCLDKTDELICFWDRGRCGAGTFACSDGRGCKRGRCLSTDTCSNKAHWFWCPNGTDMKSIYRGSKLERSSSYERSCYKQPNVQIIPNAAVVKMSSVVLTTRKNVDPIKYRLCNRGFYLTAENGTKFLCFCPPSFYGDGCQFTTRRITIFFRFDRRHRSDIPSTLTVLAMLVYNRSQIIDHQYFTDINVDYPPKAFLYLLYPRPKFRGLYSVRIEAYYLTDLLFAWEYLISPFDFLPVFRLAKILRFPERNLPWLCSQNLCQNNGTCYIMNNGQHLCLCQRGWKGIFCEQVLDNIKCAPHSLVRDRHICICPYGYLEPHCFVRNTACDRVHSCVGKEVCYPPSHQPARWYRCACNISNCETRKTFITFHRQEPNSLPFLLQLLKISADYPRVRQQILLYPSTHFPITITIKTRDIRNIQGAVPEIGLLFTFEPLVRSVTTILHLLFINCSIELRNYTVDLDRQPQQCQSMTKTEFHSLTLLRRFCEQPDHHPCFLLEGYICYCQSETIKQSECISYHQRYTTCTHCLNQGYCIQGDLQNKSDFVCVCPTCASGELCQFSPSRFSISLEYLFEMTHWHHYHFIGPSIFLLVGMIFNILNLITFLQPKTRTKGSGFFLLVNSIISQLTLIFLFVRVLYLYLGRQVIINEQLNNTLCKSLSYVMPSLYYISLWLTTFVTIERALAATFSGRFSSLQSPKSAGLLTLFVSIIILSSNYIHINQYKLVSHPDTVYPWCISEIKPGEQYLNQYLSLIHQVLPFLTNLIGSLIIIVAISRSKATSHHLRARDTLVQQVRERLELLLGPTICFITQLPQFIILFLDVCNYNSSSWFIHLLMVTYYISFTPQISLFFLYVLPSPLYRETLFKQTRAGKQLVTLIPSLARLIN